MILARDQKKIDEAIPQIQAANAATRVSGISADVSVRAPVQAACEKAIQSMGGQERDTRQNNGLTAERASTLTAVCGCVCLWPAQASTP